MKCMRCGEEMRNTIGGCYTCDNCGFEVNDCVLRMSFKNGKKGRKIDNIIDGKDLIDTGKITDVTINGESFAKGEVWDKTTNIDAKDLGTLGAYFEADAAQKKIKDLEKQLAEKNKRIEKLKDKMETWQSELFDKLAEVKQIIDDYSVEIPMGNKTPSLMLIGSKEFENVIDEIMDKFAR